MMNSTRRKRPQGPKRQARRPNMLDQAVINHPPQIQSYEVRHSTRMRFVTNVAVIQLVTFQNLLDTILMALTATTGADLFYGVKVRRVQLWANPAIGTATSVSVAFAGGVPGVTGDQKLHTDTSMGVQPAHVSAKPASKSTLSNYQTSSVDEAFVVTGPSGMVVDVELSFVGQYNAAVACQNVLVAAVPGAVYLRGLDGLAVAATKFVPIYAPGSI